MTLCPIIFFWKQVYWPMKKYYWKSENENMYPPSLSIEIFIPSTAKFPIKLEKSGSEHT